MSVLSELLKAVSLEPLHEGRVRTSCVIKVYNISHAISLFLILQNSGGCGIVRITFFLMNNRRGGYKEMSQITKRALEASLKKLLTKKPLDKITITDITEDCGINRMTFYYHFKDIYDLVEWVCVEDATRILGENKTYDTWQEGFLRIFEAVSENKTFMMNAYHSISRDQVEKYLYSLTYDLMIKVIEDKAKNMQVRDEDKKIIADNYKCNFVGVMIERNEKSMKRETKMKMKKMRQMKQVYITRALEAFRTDAFHKKTES